MRQISYLVCRKSFIEYLTRAKTAENGEIRLDWVNWIVDMWLQQFLSAPVVFGDGAQWQFFFKGPKIPGSTPSPYKWYVASRENPDVRVTPRRGERERQ